MILLFTGAGGTGKTTMAKAAAKRYGVPYLESSSREVQLEHGVTCEDDQLLLSPAQLTEVQQAITERYWRDVCDKMVDPDEMAYVADRTLACHFTYRVMKGWSEIDEVELATYETRMLMQFTSAHLVVHCPVGLFEPPSDGFRTDDKVQRDVFDRIIRGTLDRVRDKINLMSMTVASHEARAQHLHSALLNVHAVEPEITSGPRDERRLIRP